MVPSDGILVGGDRDGANTITSATSSVWIHAHQSSPVPSSQPGSSKTFLHCDSLGSPFNNSARGIYDNLNRNDSDATTFLLSRSTSKAETVGSSTRTGSAGVAAATGTSTSGSCITAPREAEQPHRRRRNQRHYQSPRQTLVYPNMADPQTSDHQVHVAHHIIGSRLDLDSDLDSDFEGHHVAILLDRRHFPSELISGDERASDPEEDISFYQLFDNYPQLLLDERPSSSCSHLQHANQPETCACQTTRYSAALSDKLSLTTSSVPSTSVTKAEFETLPSTVQRKYFSTVERLRFAQKDSLFQYLDLASSTDVGLAKSRLPSEQTNKKRRHICGRRLASTPVATISRNQTHIDSKERSFYASLPEKIKRRHLSEQEQFTAQRRPQSLVLDKSERAFVKLGSRQPQSWTWDSDSCLVSPTSSTPENMTTATPVSQTATMETEHVNQANFPTELSSASTSMLDSFRWLDEEGDLDLKLYLDDYHSNLRQEAPSQYKPRRPPSFRRHLSISKLPFARSSTSSGGPVPNDASATPRSASAMGGPVTGMSGHARRKSRALSLISPHKQPSQDNASTFDPSAAHYQDPEARKKLRAYLATPQMFDEALEYGFPSVDDTQSKESKISWTGSRDEDVDPSDKMGTFFDDDVHSFYSGEASMTDTDSPQTPDAINPHIQSQSLPVSSGSLATQRDAFAPASATSREMTLRMTLTRPDLRAREDDIYGRKVGTMSRIHMREGSLSPLPYAREGGTPKDYIERQFAAMDFEHAAAHDPGVMKRFWNRVRRS